jgi:hypothetical protein
MEKKMLVNLNTEQVVPQIMIEDIGFTLNSIEGFKDLEYLQEYQWEDLKYDLNLLHSAKSLFRHYSLHQDWAQLDNYWVEVDFDLTETETGIDYDRLDVSLMHMAAAEVTDKPPQPHPSHNLYVSDSSLYDYKCEDCHHTDITGGGWGKLTDPCPGEWTGN